MPQKMDENHVSATTVSAAPTKRFFVSMLTRDIALKDAILDLLDNCVDGILRILPGEANTSVPYEGYWARVVCTPDHFSITDNCGGIPRAIAVQSAFRLGRVDDNRDEHLATVGMYGIGMKRAIFKMGEEASVRSKHAGDSYEVKISSEWLRDDNNWTLELKDVEIDLNYDGTQIVVSSLLPEVAEQFDHENPVFLQDLEKDIQSLFALIIRKGLSVYLNDKLIVPVNLDILFTRDFSTDSIQPWAMQAEIDDVSIDILVGFYRELSTVEELESEQTLARARDNAGWTVICNDRVVLHKDKSDLTGWGLGVPRYHPQFISIAGVVRFTSTVSLNLPLTTTKRGLDVSSRVYRFALRFMREGLKRYTDFTNKWKGREKEASVVFKAAVLTDPVRLMEDIPEDKWAPVRNTEGAKRFAPELPVPPVSDRRVSIRFTRVREDVQFVGMILFDNPDADPSEIGGACFDNILKSARENDV